MFKRFLKVHRFSSSPTLREPPKPPRAVEDESSVLKIVHPGGKTERYYMAIPAAKILERYPTCELAKPEVFIRPWSSVVRPEKILTPGQKFLLVPRRSVKKLRKMIKKPSRDAGESSSSFISQASNFSLSRQSDVSSSSFVPESDKSVVSSSFSKSTLRKHSGVKKHVMFAGIDNVEDKAGAGAGHGQRRTRYLMGWQPRLAMINESERQGMAP